MIIVCYAEPAIVTITRHLVPASTYVTLNLTNSCSASADLVSYAEMTLSKAITMATTVTVTPTVEVTPSSTNPPTSGTYIVKCNYTMSQPIRSYPIRASSVMMERRIKLLCWI